MTSTRDNRIIRLKTDYDYYVSLYTDSVNKIRALRDIQRVNIRQLIMAKLPETIEESLTSQEQRLLRSHLLQNKFGTLTLNDQMEMKKLQEKLNRLEIGGCYNIDQASEIHLTNANRIFKFQFEGHPVTICIDVTQARVNDDLGMVNVIFDLRNDRFDYPLDDNLVDSFLGQVLMSPWADSTKRLRFKDISDAQHGMLLAKDELKRLGVSV